MEGAKPLSKNGVKIDRFLMVNELNAKGVPDFVAAFCHELGHGFGLPDMYDTTGISLGLGKVLISWAWEFTGWQSFLAGRVVTRLPGLGRCAGAIGLRQI